VAERRVSKGWRTWIPFTTGSFIRDYLLEKGEACVYEVWDAFRRRLKEMGVEWWGSYDSFRRYFYMLARLNLIRFVREGPSSRPWLHPKRYYAVVPENADLIEAWNAPQVVLYPATVYGKRRYRKKLEEASKLGVSVEELAIMEHPWIAEARRRLLA